MISRSWLLAQMQKRREVADAAARSSLHRLHVEDGTEVHLQLVGDKLLQFLLGQGYLPAIEIHGLLVVIVQYLREDFLILRVAESRRITSMEIVIW